MGSLGTGGLPLRRENPQARHARSGVDAGARTADALPRRDRWPRSQAGPASRSASTVVPLRCPARRAVFELLRSLHAGDVVCEPRHATWTSPAATRLLESFRIARVAADPPRAAGLEAPGGWPGLVYYRWHGSPRPYLSPYSSADLDRLATAIRPNTVDTWCIFDNTGSGSAAGNALDLIARLTRPDEPHAAGPHS